MSGLRGAMFEKIPGLIMKSGTAGHTGKTENVVGMSMEASGERSSIGDTVLIYNEEQDRQTSAEVVGFEDGRIQLTIYEATGGIASSSFVRNTGRRLKVPVGDFSKGRIINVMERPTGGRSIFHANQYYTVNSPYMNPLDEPPTRDRLEFGIRAIDGLNTIGKGQRIGMFVGSDVGKSTLMGMIARNVKMNINIITLVRERDREVLEFAQRDLGEEGMKCSVLVVATSDQPAMLRMKCPLVATTIAEYFRDQGFDVLLMMDSLTRYTVAQREIGLAIGEPSIARGYTPPIYAEFPKLLERSGSFSQGSMMRIYTVLMEGDDTNEPIADMARGILDGHIALSRQLANENYFPAIDIGVSISRFMVEIVDEEHCRISSRLRNTLSLHRKNSDPISIGAYKEGINAVLDEVVSKINKMSAFLQQGIDERFFYGETLGFTELIVE